MEVRWACISNSVPLQRNAPLNPFLPGSTEKACHIVEHAERTDSYFRSHHECQLGNNSKSCKTRHAHMCHVQYQLTICTKRRESS